MCLGVCVCVCAVCVFFSLLDYLYLMDYSFEYDCAVSLQSASDLANLVEQQAQLINQLQKRLEASEARFKVPPHTG